METTRPRVEPPGEAVPFALNHMRVIDFRATQRPIMIRSCKTDQKGRRELVGIGQGSRTSFASLTSHLGYFRLRRQHV